MPFIITTQEPTHRAVATGEMVLSTISRHAVATIDEARENAYEMVARSVNDTEHEGTPGDGLKDATYDLTESGGTIGPLPDGTVIEVDPTTYDELRVGAGLVGVELYGLRDERRDQIIDAYNESHQTDLRARPVDQNARMRALDLKED